MGFQSYQALCDSMPLDVCSIANLIGGRGLVVTRDSDEQAHTRVIGQPRGQRYIKHAASQGCLHADELA